MQIYKIKMALRNFFSKKSKQSPSPLFSSSLLCCGLCMLATLLFSNCRSSLALKEGDLLFHVSPEQNAITEVTPGMIDHVAIYLGRGEVIEAVGRGVVVTPLDSLQHQDGLYLVGRTKADIASSLSNAKRFLGRSYDWLYLPDNDEIYCSELVQFSFVDKQGQPMFSPIPMSFHDSTGKITDYWTQFYARHDMNVPEGAPGTNPSELAQRPAVRLLGPLKTDGRISRQKPSLR